jgi:formyltetrahydrofolate deformylase
VVLASREDRCVLDLLWRWRRFELAADIVGVVSNVGCWRQART